MSTAKPIAIAAFRNELLSLTIRVIGVDLTAAAAASTLRSQIRLYPGAPGPALVSLATVATAAAEGIKLDSVVTTAGVPTSTLIYRINQSTMADFAKLPLTGEIGTASRFAFGIQWSGATHIYGDFVVLPNAMDSDNTPLVGAGYGGFGTVGASGGPTSNLVVTVSNGDVLSVTIDGAEVVGASVARAQQAVADAAAQAERARGYTQLAGALLASTPLARDVATAAESPLNPNGVLGGPSAIFGDGLIAHFSSHSRYVDANGNLLFGQAVDTAKAFGAGRFEQFAFPADQAPQIRLDSGLRYNLRAANPGMTAMTADGAGQAWLAGTRPFFQHVGTFLDSNAAYTYWATAKWRLQRFVLDAKKTVTVRLEEFTTEWTPRAVWTADYVAANASTLTTLRNDGSVRQHMANMLEFFWDRAAGTFNLRINGQVIAATTVAPAATVITPGAVQVGPIPSSYSTTFASDGDFDDADKLTAWLSRPMEAVMREDRTATEIDTTAIVSVQPSTYPVSSTLGGPTDLVDLRLTVGAAVQGDMPIVDLSGGPNVRPFVYPHNRKNLNANVLRFCVMPHPDDPTDPSRMIALANMLYLPTDTDGQSFTGLFESLDSGVSYAPVDIAARGFQPAAALPAGTTSTINNIVQPAGSQGRALYAPGAATAGPAAAFDYFILNETWGGSDSARLFGIGNPFDPSTYQMIPVRQHSWPHPFYDERADYMSFAASTSMFAGQPYKPSVEEKQLGYDPVSGRFWRLTRADLPSFRYDGSFRPDFFARTMMLAWSKPGDPSRWEKPLPLVQARNSGWQAYDATIVQRTPDCWLLFVSNYADYGATYANGAYVFPAGSERANRQLQMSIDLYAIYPRESMTPVLLRADWAANPADATAWNHGMMYVYPHPFNPNQLYVAGARGLHNTQNGYIGDWATKVRLVDYQVPAGPAYIKPDRHVASGTFSSRPFFSRDVQNVRIDTNIANDPAADGVARVRVVDHNTGRIVPGCDFVDGAVQVQQTALWNGLDTLPRGVLRIEVELGPKMQFSGIYPQLEPAP